jgi:phosphoribosylformylglycinamidine synthase
LKSIIPGSEHWPTFTRNLSEQFEARLVRVEVLSSPSILFTGMENSLIPIVASHGEGRVVWGDSQERSIVKEQNLIVMRYVDNYGVATETYPANPNGSADGITGLTTHDGRITILMPHPERVFRTAQFSWHPNDWNEDSPWMRMFANARAWVA